MGEVDEALGPPVGVVADHERDESELTRKQARGEALALADAFDALPSPPAGEQDAVLLVEHNHCLAALLDQGAAANGVGVHPSAF